jgi:hypothetical protein
MSAVFFVLLLSCRVSYVTPQAVHMLVQVHASTFVECSATHIYLLLVMATCACHTESLLTWVGGCGLSFRGEEHQYNLHAWFRLRVARLWLRCCLFVVVVVCGRRMLQEACTVRFSSCKAS